MNETCSLLVGPRRQFLFISISSCIINTIIQQLMCVTQSDYILSVGRPTKAKVNWIGTVTELKESTTMIVSWRIYELQGGGVGNNFIPRDLIVLRCDRLPSLPPSFSAGGLINRFITGYARAAIS